MSYACMAKRGRRPSVPDYPTLPYLSTLPYEVESDIPGRHDIKERR